MKRRFFHITLLLALIGFSLDAAATPDVVPKQVIEMRGDSVIVPLKQAGKLILFEAEIAGVTGNVVLDTGASGLVLNETYYRDYTGRDAIEVAGIGSNGVAASRTLIRSLKLRSIHYKNVTADIIPLGHLENKRNIKILGLFGLEQLTDFEVELDLRNLQMVIRKKPLNSRQKPTLSLHMTVSKRCVLLQGSVQNTPLKLALDTGTETNEYGFENSVLNLGEPTSFSLYTDQDAKEVILAGSFNDWNEHAIQMKKEGNLRKAEVVLPPGNYEYKFIVDGKWTLDPRNEIHSGSGDFENNVHVESSTQSFLLEGFAEASEVICTGTFNGWNETGYTMIKTPNGWELDLHLAPGKYTYKL
ncbi:MAG: aspartyl protease family protein [Flavobacteriales bacterium]|nr:aspartyl protease family protein [Flavobacteriales bacterium]MDG1779597.1 aspartyl protease family protein [Flavobacteriales bacterium]MDG2247077.1 aspartyl protease family protein [Flavobacteriales bacterium]